MKRAAVLILVVLAVCLAAVADPSSATDPTARAKDLVLFGKQDLAHGLATTALAYFNEALQTLPNSADAWAGKARALDILKRYDEARTASQKALQFAPDNPYVWATEGKILLDERQYNDALSALNKSLTLRDDTTVWRWKGQALESLGRHEEAQNAFVKATPPPEHYRGGITRLTSGGPREQQPEKDQGKIEPIAPNTTGAEPQEQEEETPPAEPQGSVWPFDYGNEEQPEASAPTFGGYETEYVLPGTYYYDDGGSVGDFHKRGHRSGEAYENDYDNGTEDGGGPVAVAPRTVAPYRGVVPLYQQSVVPQYFQGVVPPYQQRVDPDYRGAAGNPIICDRWNFQRGSGMGHRDGNRRHGHRGGR